MKEMNEKELPKPPEGWTVCSCFGAADFCFTGCI